MAKAATPTKPTTAPVPPQVADPFGGKILTTTEELVPKTKPLPPSVLAFAETLRGNGTATVNVSAWDDEQVKEFTGIVRKNARTLFPGKRVRITPGQTVSGAAAVQFKLGELGTRKNG